MEDFTGYLLHEKRLAQNMKQSELCAGICSISYLSKIESGAAKAGSDVLTLLFRRLGVTDWSPKPASAEERALLMRFFTAVLLRHKDMTALRNELAPLAPRWEATEMEPNKRLFELYDAYLRSEDLTAALREALPFRRWMSAGQQLLLSNLYTVCHAAEEMALSLARQADEAYPCSLSAMNVATCCFVRGSYQEALRQAEHAFDRAVREGCVTLMADASMTIGNCYANLGELPLMRDAMTRAAALLPEDRVLQAEVAYNLGATYMEFGYDREALPELRKTAAEEAAGAHTRLLALHKLTLSLSALHRRDEAAACLTRARALLADYDAAYDREMITRLLALAELRLNPDYLDDPAYETALTALCRNADGLFPHGFVQFHERFLEELLCHKRRYKEAYRLVKAREDKRSHLD